MTEYPLAIGTHSVVGEVVGYGDSAPIQFEVVPEPATVSFLFHFLESLREEKLKAVIVCGQPELQIITT